MLITSSRSYRRSGPLRVGFVPLSDCAPLAMAQELGLFRKYELAVELKREVGWATVRDKVIYGELDAAQAVAGLVFSCRLGLGSVSCDCLTGLVLNLHGNAITLSTGLRERGVQDAVSLRREVDRIRARRRLTLGVAFSYSSHYFVLCEWLRRVGIHPGLDVEIVTVPPPQMFGNLQAGHLDGYCVGEPWNSVAVMHRLGWCVATSSDIAPRHPEKILLVRREFAEGAEQEHLALIAALLEACAFCDRPENRERIMETLAEPQFVGAPIQALRMSMQGTFNFGLGRIEKDRDFHVFSRYEANAPTLEKGEWVLGQMKACGSLRASAFEDDPAFLRAQLEPAFRMDIYTRARHLAASFS